jgi:mannose-6-phosphate isomerase-like protein (cupin superfamily)
MMCGFLTAKAEKPRIDSYDWGRMEWLIDNRSHENPGFSLARMIVSAGRVSEPHKHILCHEAISVTTGQCTVVLNNESILMQAGQSVFVTKGTPHFIDNMHNIQDVELLITYALGTRDYHPL